MPTVNIKSTYGAVGDGQRVTAIITANTASPHAVSATTAVWTPVTDVGKEIMIEGIGNSTAPNNLTLATTITAVAGDGKSITIAGSVVTNVSASSQVITWGTSDVAAFQAFNVAQQNVANVILTIPAGIYLLNSWPAGSIGNGAKWLRGIPGVQVIGSGSPLLAGFFSLGGFTWPTQEGVYPITGKVATVNRGASSVTLLTPSQYTRFQPGNTYTLSDGTVYVAGTKAVLSGIDTQGYGDPPNPGIWEFVTITNVNTSSGLITLSGPIRNTYLSTWPAFNTGSIFSSNQGGPATISMLDASWDTSVSITGIRFYTPAALCSMAVKNFTITSCTWLNEYGPDPSVNQNYTADSCDLSICNTEMDKTIENLFVQNGTTWRRPNFFSSSVENFYVKDSTISSLLKGFARNNIFTNSTIASIQFSPESYGYTNFISMSNCVVSSIDSTRTVVDTDIITAGWTISNGVITSPAPPIRWGLPGVIMNFRGQVSSETNFKVLELNTNGSITTSLTGQSSFPNVPLGSGTILSVAEIPYLFGYFENNTGCNDIVDLSQILARGKRFGEYSKRTYAAVPTGTQIDINSSPAGPIMYGLLKSLTINVSSAFTTAGTQTASIFGRFRANGIDLPVNGALTSWLPTVNLKTAGIRTWTATGGWSGVVAGDSLADPGQIWLTQSQVIWLNNTLSASDPGVISIEITTDQGFKPIAPILQLHS